MRTPAIKYNVLQVCNATFRYVINSSLHGVDGPVLLPISSTTSAVV